MRPEIKFKIINHLKLPKQILIKKKYLKIVSLSFKSLPLNKERLIKEEFELALEINELEMELSCICKNERAFELSYLQIKPFFFWLYKK